MEIIKWTLTILLIILYVVWSISSIKFFIKIRFKEEDMEPFPLFWLLLTLVVLLGMCISLWRTT
jgi:hypothetical protein